MTYNQSNKKSIYKWRDNNKAEWNEYMSKINIMRYYDNKDLINNRRKELYHLRKNPFFLEAEIFRRILL